MHNSVSKPRVGWLVWLCTPTALVVVGLCALSFGRYSVDPQQTINILINQVVSVEPTWTDMEYNAIINIRLPRVLLSMLVGSGLAIAGAALQAVFGNPIVSPQALGVSSAASCGGVFAIMLHLGSFGMIVLCCAFGILALIAVFLISRVRGTVSIVTIVLAGIVIGSFFSAITSLMTYIADPYSEMPAIVFWLLGSLAAASMKSLEMATIPILIGSVMLVLLRWRINILSLGDEEARALGMHPQRIRWILLFAVSLIVAGAVSVSGVIGWVGLVVPHLTRALVGSDNRLVIPQSLLFGAVYLTIIDTITRSLATAEIPLGVLTAIIGAPVFVWILRRSTKGAWA